VANDDFLIFRHAYIHLEHVAAFLNSAFKRLQGVLRRMPAATTVSHKMVRELLTFVSHLELFTFGMQDSRVFVE
jgi:hypothetical protein